MTGTCFHNHLIPGVDDGARDASFSAGALAAFRREGVTQVITTPHFLGSLTEQPDALAARLAELDAGWEVLRGLVDEDAKTFGNAMRVERGVEVMLDVPAPVLTDARVRLAGTRYVLVEFAAMQIPPVNAAAPLHAICQAGYVPVLAHPERYRNLETLAPLNEFIAAGALLQVNAGSLFGDYGSKAQGRAREILTQGFASFVCSDYHARGEPGLLRFAQTLEQAGFGAQAQLLLEENPGRLLNDQPVVAVPPMATPSQKPASTPWWKQMLGEG
jgi:protein-tyrosine phosphatase